MPNPRTPIAKAEVSGALVKNPQRRKGKASPKVAVIGSPPSWFSPAQKQVWAAFQKELPWLTQADRAVMEIACTVRALLTTPGSDVGVSKLNLLRLCLAQLGATPADRSKITVPDAEDEDSEDSFFGETTH